MKPPPVCKAFLICEHVLHDRIAGGVSLININNKFQSDTFPAGAHGGFGYLQLTNGIGRYLLSLEVHDLADGTLIFRKDFEHIDFESRTEILVYYFSLTDLSLPHAGGYDLVVLAEGQEVERQRIRIHPPGEPRNA